MNSRFRARAFTLAKAPTIERVSSMYMHYGEEVVSIDFRGNECGLLSASVGVIVHFFSELARKNRD
jgi:hypothetical protein